MCPSHHLLHSPHRLEAHQLRTVLVHQAFTRGHGLADAILLAADHAVHADIKRRDPPVNFRMSDKALLDTQHIERLHPVGPAVNFGSVINELFIKARTVARRHGDFIGLLARERNPEQTRSYPLNRDRTAAHIREAHVINRRINDPIDHIARLWPRDPKLRPLLGDRDHLCVQIGPYHLQHIFKVAHHKTRRRRGRRHHIVVVRQTRRGAIIQHMAVFAQHQSITDLADLQRRERICINEIQQRGRIRPLHVNLAKGRHIHDPNSITDHIHLAVARLPPRGLACNREIAWPIPKPRFDHRRSCGNACLMRCREAFRRKAFTMRPRPHRRNRHGHKRRTEGRRARLGDAPPCRIGQHGQSHHIG